MNARSVLRQAIERLATAQVPSATTTAEVLLLHVLGRDRAFLYAHPEAELSLEQERAYRHLVTERASGKPTQYLTGEQEFWGLSFFVRPGAFIPRPETEHIVEVALKIVRQRMASDRVPIVDVGTGTGCIALALASELPEAEIIGVDIDPNAVALARENAERLNLGHRLQFLQSDLLEAFLPPEARSPKPDARVRPPDARSLMPEARFDLVVSNPPYVSEAEADRLPREVRDHEPPTALYAPDEGLGLTRRLIAEAEKLLAVSAQPSAPDPRITRHEPPAPVPGSRFPNHDQPARTGWLVIELGYQMSQRVRALLGDAWTNIEVTDDLRGIPRVLAAQKK